MLILCFTLGKRIAFFCLPEVFCDPKICQKWVFGPSALRSSRLRRSPLIPRASLVSPAALGLRAWTACADFPNVVAQCHILGVCTQAGLWSPSSNSIEILHPKFHHPMFTRSAVIMLTNKHTNKHSHKQTPLKTSNVLGYVTTQMRTGGGATKGQKGQNEARQRKLFKPKII